MSKRDIPSDIEAELTSAGVQWHVETGGRHRKLYVGPILACIFPLGHASEGRKHFNTRAQVRRAIKEVSRG